MTAAFERGRHPDVHNPYCGGLREHPLTKGEHVRVIVRTSKAGRLLVPAYGTAYTAIPIGRHCFAITRPAEHDASIALTLYYSVGCEAYKVRIVDRRWRRRAEVSDLMSALGQMIEDDSLVSKPSVV